MKINKFKKMKTCLFSNIRREREREKERVSGCMCVCVILRDSEWVCVCKRESACVCVCKRERERVSESEKLKMNKHFFPKLNTSLKYVLSHLTHTSKW